MADSESEWKMTRREYTIELRKTFDCHPHFTQVLVVMSSIDDIKLSMNGKAKMSREELRDMVAEVTRVANEEYGDE